MPDDWAVWDSDYNRRASWKQHLKLTANAHDDLLAACRLVLSDISGNRNASIEACRAAIVKHSTDEPAATRLRKRFSKMPRRQYMISACTGERTLVNSVVCTYCDFGEAGRKTRIGQHLTIVTALSQYARLFSAYHIHRGFKVWQELTELGHHQRKVRRHS